MDLSRRAWVASLVALSVGSTASCLLTSDFDGLTGHEASSTTSSTGTMISSTGGSTPGTGGAGGAGGTDETGGTVITAGSTGGAGGGTGGGSSCLRPSISGPFPTTCILDRFERADSDAIGVNWFVPVNSDWAIKNRQLAVLSPVMSTLHPGAILWGDVKGADQEVFVTVNKFTVNDFEIELLLKGQAAAVECDGFQVYFHVNSMPGLVGATSCVTNGGNDEFTSLGQELPSMIMPGDQIGARATKDGNLIAYVNGAEIAHWSTGGHPFADLPGRIGIETDSIVDELLFDEFGGGGK